ncbi:M14 family metallopeptidase [Salipaludibacillus aurantiacus]|uniref:Murein tripeptide amidase MpaA n=1 Tax=Salipaludibacillus aurantiacus TaxID=1601833 RepID=A0A1H9S9F1_9BACI|nr:M14 family zinc carboxypeptidase [Salipaludibacillus aurantiacus]SER81591.1 Murein tripeptide amidase MpaA [Salipaludibacillus aurantiacus]
MKRLSAGWLAVVMLLAFVLPSSLAASAPGTVHAEEVIDLEVSQSIFSMTETRTVEIHADFGREVDLDQLEFQFGGKSLSEWKKWSGGTTYDGEPFINVIEEPSFVDGTTKVTAKLEFGLPYNTTNLANRTIRVQYQQFIGDYELALIDSASGLKAATEVKLNVYDEFLFYEELKPAIDEVFSEAEADENNTRYLEYQNIGQSVEGRDMHFVILAKDEEAVDKYLNDTLPAALEDPESLLEKLENGTMGEYQVPIWFNNIHPDEVEGVDAQVELLKKFALQEEITFINADENNEEAPVTLNVDEVLDDVIFLYMFTNNPDGRVANTRSNANGFDLNRDNTNQTQVETQLVTKLIAEWTPLSFLDMHGYVNGFLIEPATPPHNPNFEYDLLIGNMLGQAHSLGRAGIGNSPLTSYFIARLAWESGWDDMTPAYTPMYTMLHGALGHTIEVPTLGQESLYAMEGTGLGAALFVTENKDDLYKGQLEIFKRGVNGEDNRAVDEYFVNAAGESIGRVRGGEDSFFPDYYVIPADESNQENILEAHKMIEYLLRNGVKVEETTAPVTTGGVTYPAGTFVVPMDQAKRGLANAVLYKGDNVSDWPAMYDPIVVNFPALRGFNAVDVRDIDVFEGLTSDIHEVAVPTGRTVGKSPKQILRNSTNDSIKLVNALLKEGKNVELVKENKARASKGDFIVETKDLKSYENDFYFETEAIGNASAIKTSRLSKPKVAATGSAQLRFSLRELGYDLVDQSEADVIVSDGSSFNSEQVSGKSYVGIGVYALNAVRNSGMLPGFTFDYTRANHEGLVKTDVNDHQVTAGYDENQLLYVATGSWISGVPEGANVLVTFAESDDFYSAGWWPGYEAANGETMAITKETEDASFTLFANELAFRAHTQHSYRMLANSIFSSVTAEAESKRKPKAGRKDSTEVIVDNHKVRVERTTDEQGRNKVNATVDKNELIKQGRSGRQVETFTIASDRQSGDEALELSIPADAVKELKETQPQAGIDVQFGESSYLLPLEEIELENVTMAGEDFTVSIEIEEKEEQYGGRDEEKRVLNVGHVNVKAKSGNQTEEIISFKSFEEKGTVSE